MKYVYIKGRGIGIGLERYTLKPSTYTAKQRAEIAHEMKPITREDALQDYNNLKQFDLKKITPHTRVGNKTVDYFTFPQRLNTVSLKGMSFFDFLTNKAHFTQKNYTQNLLEYYRKTGKTIDNSVFYEIFRLYFGAVNIFKPIVSMDIYNRFKPRSVLDFTMGWGGRLIGACALNVPHYIGIDLNKQLEKPYKEMVDFVKPLTTTKITLFFKDALSIDYSKLDYDMVFTSPPYYNIEIYEGTKRLDKDAWDEQFYKPIFEKTFKHLKSGGKYCLNIPVEVYDRICVPLLGKAPLLIPLLKNQRQTNKYTEMIYVWTK